MNTKTLTILSILSVVICQVSYGQALAKQVTDYMVVPDTVVVIKDVTIIDGTGGEIKEHQDVLLLWIDGLFAIGLDRYPVPKVIWGPSSLKRAGRYLFHCHILDAIHKVFPQLKGVAELFFLSRLHELLPSFLLVLCARLPPAHL